MADNKDSNGFHDRGSDFYTDFSANRDKNETRGAEKQKFVVHIDDSVDDSFDYDFEAFSSADTREAERRRREESRASFKQFEEDIRTEKANTSRSFGEEGKKSERKKVPAPEKTVKQKRSKSKDVVEKAKKEKPAEDTVEKKTKKSSKKIVERGQPKKQPEATDSGDNAATETEKTVVRLKTRSKRGILSGFLGFIIITLVFTLILTSTGLSTIGDVVAYNRKDESITVVIEDEKNGDSPTLEHVIGALHSAGLVKQKYLCTLFAKFRHFDGYTDPTTGGWVPTEYLSGVYYLEPGLGIEGMLNTIKKSNGKGAATVTLVFPEGWTISQIFERLEKNGVCEQSKLYANIETVARQYDFYYNINQSGLRYLGVEGYLFPDTYEFYKNENAVSVLKKMFDNANAKWKKSYEKKAKALGYSRDEILIIASIIQREAANSSQMGDISSVIHNRMKSSTYPSLQCNSTLDYVTNSVKNHVDSSLAEIYLNAYNTYRVEGLPPGPICNPGKDAIEAALNPNETQYYFFVHNKKGKIYLSETYNQFSKDCAQVAKDNA